MAQLINLSQAAQLFLYNLSRAQYLAQAPYWDVLTPEQRAARHHEIDRLMAQNDELKLKGLVQWGPSCKLPHTP